MLPEAALVPDVVVVVVVLAFVELELEVVVVVVLRDVVEVEELADVVVDVADARHLVHCRVLPDGILEQIRGTSAAVILRMMRSWMSMINTSCCRQKLQRRSRR